MNAVECETCSGSGHEVGNSFRVCGTCIGAGETYRDVVAPRAHLTRFLVVRPGGYIHSEHKTLASAQLRCGPEWLAAGDRIVKCTLVVLEDC